MTPDPTLPHSTLPDPPRGSQLRKIGDVDVLLIPVGGVYTINGLDAQKVVEQLKPKRVVIPMHYATFPVLTGTPEDFSRELKQRGTKAEMRAMKVGDTIPI